MRLGLLAAAGVGICVGLGACDASSPPRTDAGASIPRTDVAMADARVPAANTVIARSSLTQINGQSFPDHVLALTWDDGPDTGSLALAEYLHQKKVSATFFVVNQWVRGVSSDPGEGPAVYQTGYAHLPILGRLVALGHRLGNHTLHHVLLSEVPPADADAEVRGNQEGIDPFLTNELRLFRAPGGAWSAAAAASIAADPSLRDLVGPIRWDIDRKDWDASSSVKASVTAARYLESIEEAKRGIVLLHDRVGQVGSSYALDLARALVPALQARGYVFAAPVLAFSPLVVRAPGGARARSIRIVDVDGDGRADLVVRDATGASCVRSVELPGTAADPRPRAAFQGDVPCTAPAVALLDRGANPPLRGDLNGDGRDDACNWSPAGVVCALATAKGFTTQTTWLAGAVPDGGSLQLADVNGDGRADLCADSPAGVVCGLAP